MVDVLKSGERNVVERVVAKALNRRALLTKSMLVAGAWSAGAGFDAAKAAQSAERASGGNANVVLAHGAWADGSSWSKVIVGLNARGVKARAAPLPLTSLADDIAALDRTLVRIDGPVILPGHAYA